MVTAWYLDHNENPGERVLTEDIYDKTGILYYRLNIETFDSDGRIQAIRKERQYGYQDILDISPQRMPNYETRVQVFHTEHQHPEEEIRMVLKGIAYFDVRDKNDVWVRLQMTPGDLVVLPPGIYHRLTMIDEYPEVMVYRLFKESPTWTAINRHSTQAN